MSAKLALGSEQLKLYITNRRLIVARKGKRGAGALAGSSLLGRFSEALEELFRGGRESLHRRRVGKVSPETILAAHKDNFDISYEDIIKVELSQSPDESRMTILTKDDKFVFQISGGLGRVQNVLEKTLGSKTVILATTRQRNLP